MNQLQNAIPQNASNRCDTSGPKMEPTTENSCSTLTTVQEVPKINPAHNRYECRRELNPAAFRGAGHCDSPPNSRSSNGILSGYYIRQRLHAGDHVHVGDLEGTVREVGPVATIIETEEDGLLNRRSVPNTKMLNEAVR